MFFESRRDKERFYKRGINVCRPHFHSSTEILYVVSGEKRAVVNDREYVLTSGEVLFCPCYHVHSFFSGEKESIVVTIKEEDCPEFYNLCQNQTPESLVIKDESGEILDSLTKLEKTTNDFVFTSVVYGVLGEFIEKVKFVKKTDRREKGFIDELYKYVNDNYARQISLGEVASVFGYSRTYFSALFRKNFGMGFSEYLNSVRVKKSLKLINFGNVSSVYLSVGFNSPQQYFLNFKKFYGISPKEYLKNK